MINKKDAGDTINTLFVEVFNNILFLEERYIKDNSSLDITITEVHVLEAVDLDEQKSMGAIAKRLLVTEGTLTTSVNKLIKKGFITKKQDIIDKRIWRLALTRKAIKILTVHAKFHKDMTDFTIKDVEKNANYEIITALSNLKDFFKDMKSRYR